MAPGIGPAGARTPEELEMLFEDALVMRDGAALGDLFDQEALLVTGGKDSASGARKIARLALATWHDDYPYLANPLSVSQAGDLALVVAERSVNVARRELDGSWRYAIVCQQAESPFERSKTMTQETTISPMLEPVAVASDGGEARWWFDSLAIIRATAADTGGQMSIIEVINPAGDQAPLHVHYHEDEGFWILDGEVTFEVGEVTIEAHAGDYVFGPRGIPHRYTVGPSGCRMLFIMTPGGFEDLVIAMSRPATTRTLPLPATEEPDWERVAAIAAAHGCELLG